jgi:hypothetical protein
VSRLVPAKALLVVNSGAAALTQLVRLQLGALLPCVLEPHANQLPQWDRCLSSMLIRSGLGVGFGIVFSVLLFKRRAWPAWVGLGFGAGRAWEECDGVSGSNPREPS